VVSVPKALRLRCWTNRGKGVYGVSVLSWLQEQRSLLQPSHQMHFYAIKPRTFISLQCFDTVGNKPTPNVLQAPACRMLGVGLLVVTIWLDLARLMGPAATTISIILISNKIQNGDILVLANPGSPARIAVKMNRETERYTALKLQRFSPENRNQRYQTNKNCNRQQQSAFI